jgi:hypothetical protein
MKITGVILKETDRAVEFQPRDSSQAHWLPRSTIDTIHKKPVGSGGIVVATIDLADWMAKDRGIDVYEDA